MEQKKVKEFDPGIWEVFMICVKNKDIVQVQEHLIGENPNLMVK